MMQGIDNSFDAVLYTGYHAAAGTQNGVLDHSYSGLSVRQIKLGNLVVGEAGLNALVFSLAAAAIVALLIFWLSRVESPFLAVAIGLIIGGAVGNVIDRIRLGAVVEIIHTAQAEGAR